MNTTTDSVRDAERLSALADDALSNDELRQMLAQMRERGIQHRAARQLERYALLGELMRAEADSPLFVQAAQRAPRDVVGSVMQQIASEDAQVARAAPRKIAESELTPGFFGGVLAGWRAPVLSMALAASVAGVMLVMTPDTGVEQSVPALTAQSAPAGVKPEANQAQDLTVPSSAVETLAELEADADNIPDPYLLQHLAHAEGGPMRTLSSNVRLASYERP